MDNQTDFMQANQQPAQAAQQAQDFQQQQPQKAKGRGGLVALAVIGLLIGVGGAGFGVYGMTQNKTAAPADLKVKIEKSDGSIVELETDKIKKAEDGSTITITDSANVAEKYIYLDGYNLGLKIPSDTKMDFFQYEYRQFTGGPNLSTLGIGGATKKEGAQALPGFVAQGNDQDIKSLGYIEICRNEVDYSEDGVNWVCAGDPIYKNDKISIYYVGPQQVASQDPDTAEWEVETVEAIKDWLTNKDNYIEL